MAQQNKMMSSHLESVLMSHGVPKSVIDDAKAGGLNIDWTAIFKQFGPIVLQLLLTFLHINLPVTP